MSSNSCEIKDHITFDVKTDSLDPPGFEFVWTPLPVSRTRNIKTTHPETQPN